MLMAVSEDMIGRNKQAAVVEHPMERTTATVCVWRCDQREVSNCCLHSSQGPEPIQIQTPPQIQPMIPSIHLMIPRLILRNHRLLHTFSPNVYVGIQAVLSFLWQSHGVSHTVRIYL
eukprot:814369_1